MRLINSTEIAFLAGVKRQAVSMWKTRYPDFPKPITHKLYSQDDIEAWLEHRRRNQ